MKTIAPMKNQVTKIHLHSDLKNWERSERHKTLKMSRKQSRQNKRLRMAIGA